MKLLVVGDSYAAAVGAKPNWLDLLEVPTALRRGRPGSTAQQWAKSSNDWLVQAQSIYVDMILISLLGNDATAAAIDNDVKADEVITGIESVMQVAAALERPWTGVFLYADPFFGKNRFTKRSIPLVNRALRIVYASFPKVHFIDLGKILGPECFDGVNIHPNAAGHAAIAAAVRAQLPDTVA